MFEPEIRFLDPGSTFWPGELFGVKEMGPKKCVCDGMIFSWHFRGKSKTQMNSIVHRTHLGRLLCPKGPLFHYFQGISNFQENWGTPWKRAPVYPLFPFVGSLFPINSRYPALGRPLCYTTEALKVRSMRGLSRSLGSVPLGRFPRVKGSALCTHSHVGE